ncbi:MAG: acetylornithine deacetylase [Pseudomonadota bacterium]
MTPILENITNHLSKLVAVPTMNPPREITADGPLVQVVREALPGFDIAVTDYGNGSIVIEAKRGHAPVLFNVHLDTVPVAAGWSRDPHTLLVTEDRATGLGACDIKGAAACLFTVAANTDAPMHLVLSTDEEAGQSTCIREYVKTPPQVTLAVVGEPTMTKAVTQHRGIFSARMDFEGVSAHSSSKEARSAVHDAAQWITDVTALPEAAENRLNVGRIEGGVKPNMIAASAEILFGFRAQPGVNHEALLRQFDASSSISAARTVRFHGPALPSDLDGHAAAAQDQARELISVYGLESSDPVDFFTEAAFFADVGVPTMVLGPGHIDQAHTADEWVALDQLLETYHAYERIVTHG